MPYDEELAHRLRKTLAEKAVVFDEKNMMGGLCILVDGKMCMGVVKDSLMVRIDPAVYREALTREGCREMDFTGRPMKGFVFVDPTGISGNRELDSWVQLGLDFNPKARVSRKRSTKAKKSA